MKTIKSKFDKDTVYKVADKSVTIKTDGEDMKFPIRMIPTVIKNLNFFPEIKAELLEIYEQNLPEKEKEPEQIPCVECGKLFTKRGKKKYCSRECQLKANAIRIAERQRKATEEKKANGVEMVCAYCGKQFVIYDNFHSKYCSAKCRDAVHREEKKNAFEKKEKKKKKDPFALSKLNQEARSKGLTYGQLQAQRYIEEMWGK